MSGDVTKLYWKFAVAIVSALMLALVGYWVSAGKMGDLAWRGIFYLLVLVAAGFVVRLKVFKDKSLFFDVDHPPSSFGKKKIVVFGRAVRDIEIESQEKLILAQSGGQSSAALIYFLNFAVGCGVAGYILGAHGLLSFFSIMTMAFLFFVQFYSPFIRQLGVLLFVAIFVGLWGLQRLDFEQRPEFLALLFSIVFMVVLASQYLRVMELARLFQSTKKSEFGRREERGLWKNAVWMASIFVVSIWVAQAWIPHESSDPESMLPAPTPKLFSPKLNRSLAEKIASFTSGNRDEVSQGDVSGDAGGTVSSRNGGDLATPATGGDSTAQAPSGSGQKLGHSGVPSPEPLPGNAGEDAKLSVSASKANGDHGSVAQNNTQASTTGSTTGSTAESSAGRESGGGVGESPQISTENSGKESGKESAGTSMKSETESRQSGPKTETPVEKEKRIQDWQERLDKIFENFKSALLLVAIVIVVILVILHFKPRKAEADDLKRIKKHTLGASDRERLKTLFQLIKGRSKSDRQEVIETYNAVLEVFNAAHYPRDIWNPVDEFSDSIEEQIPPIGNDFQSLTATFSNVLYGDQEVKRLELEKFRQDVSDILKYFRL